MIQKSTVRYVPRTGLGKKKRVHGGHIYLDEKWVGKVVIVIPIEQYLHIKKELRSATTKLSQVKELLDEYSRA